MAVTDSQTIDGIAYEMELLIMEIYDHLPFEGKFEFDHMDILQDKLNTYLWYIESEQYSGVYPNREFNKFIINIHFLYKPTVDCRKYIDNSNKKLLISNSNIKIRTIIKNQKTNQI